MDFCPRSRSTQRFWLTTSPTYSQPVSPRCAPPAPLRRASVLFQGAACEAGRAFPTLVLFTPRMVWCPLVSLVSFRTGFAPPSACADSQPAWASTESPLRPYSSPWLATSAASVYAACLLSFVDCCMGHLVCLPSRCPLIAPMSRRCSQAAASIQWRQGETVSKKLGLQKHAAQKHAAASKTTPSKTATSKTATRRSNKKVRWAACPC